MTNKDKIKTSSQDALQIPHPVDIFVGSKLRYLRRCLGMSQDILAKLVGLTFQQIQKYEKGLNRISCSKLYEFAKILGVSIQDFFDGFLENSEDIQDTQYYLADSSQNPVYDYGPKTVSHQFAKIPQKKYNLQDNSHISKTMQGNNNLNQSFSNYENDNSVLDMGSIDDINSSESYSDKSKFDRLIDSIVTNPADRAAAVKRLQEALDSIKSLTDEGIEEENKEF
ncbi:helix-turn-helix domain-containing protein [Lyticum sinuosum]|uniref:Helix-turn-helix transcriptional regulator n=1 Tax=Lyticum sinuosum TaxID=1332059 RepID=A0AAE4VL12_9RICK|nr:helix-turn-helix transcriptional regulator [Lyticum sinuosum]MDZ5761615.1 putative helix-turn-helix transcriptional regulator [Lyticum sinuosum]